MLSLIICSKYPRLSPQLERNIAETIGDTPYEIVHIDNSQGQYSIFQAYNKGVKRAKYPYLCFMHEDIVYHSQGWGEKTINHLQDERIGFLGLVGAYFEDVLSVTWSRWPNEEDYACMNFIQSDKKCPFLLAKKRVVPPVKGSEGLVTVMDGFWLSCRAELFIEKGLRWDEEYYDGFHQYDTDICMQALNAGYWNKVVYDILVEHTSVGVTDNAFFQAVVKFHQKWDSYLPIVAPGYKMPDDYIASQKAIEEIGRLTQLLMKNDGKTLIDRIKECWRLFEWEVKVKLHLVRKRST